MKLIDTNFAVKIECTELSQLVIDWVNKTYEKRYQVVRGYAILVGYQCKWSIDKKNIPNGYEILTETEFLKRLELEESELVKFEHKGEPIEPFTTVNPHDKQILIGTSILLKEYCENHRLDINLCKAI